MNFSRRLPGVALGATLLVFLLSGCSLVNDAGQVWDILDADAAAKKALNAVVNDVQGIKGVESVSSNFVADGPHGDEAAIEVVASAEITDDQLSAIATAVHEGFARADLVTAIPEFTLNFAAADEAGAFVQSEMLLTMEEFVHEVVYWRSVEAAAETGLSLTVTPAGQDGAYQRLFETPENADPIRTSKLFMSHFEALAAVPDETRMPTIWSLAGIWLTPELPSAETMAVFDDIQTFIPVMDRITPTDDLETAEYVSPEGTLLQSFATGDDGVSRAEILIVHHDFRAANWQTVVEAAALAARVPEISFRYIAADRPFQVTTCARSVNQTDDDVKFLDEVRATGAPGIDAVKAGVCSV